MIRIQNLTRKFDDLVAVDNLTMDVRDGEVFGFIGPNGAGKTTTVRMLCCLIKPTSGKAFIKENQVGEEPDSMNIRAMVGLLPESPGLYDSLSAYRNLDFFARLYEVPKAKREKNIEELLKMLGIWDRREDKVATFSKGMKQKIAIIRALVHEPEYIFLDEPTSGLDPEAAKTVRDFISDLKKEGRTIFINTHNLDEAERLCDRIAVFNKRLIDIGSPASLSRKFWKRTTVVHLESLNDRISEAVKSLEDVLKVEASRNTLTIMLDNPEETNPAIADAIFKSGGRIKSIGEERHSLEDVYMELIKGDGR